MASWCLAIALVYDSDSVPVVSISPCLVGASAGEGVRRWTANSAKKNRIATTMRTETAMPTMRRTLIRFTGPGAACRGSPILSVMGPRFRGFYSADRCRRERLSAFFLDACYSDGRIFQAIGAIQDSAAWVAAGWRRVDSCILRAFTGTEITADYRLHPPHNSASRSRPEGKAVSLHSHFGKQTSCRHLFTRT
jgi:hypothetical protein